MQRQYLVILFFGLMLVSFNVFCSSSSFDSVIKNNQLDKKWQISLSPAVKNNITMIQNNHFYKEFFSQTCQRMNQYQFISSAIQKRNMPSDLIALPFVESFFLNVPRNWNPNNPGGAGMWQLSVDVATKYHLKVDNDNDDRINVQKSTDAALNYLAALHAKFQDWKLAVLAYEIGEDKVSSLQKQTKSNNVATLVDAFQPVKYRQNLKNFVAAFDSIVIMLNAGECAHLQ